MMRTTGWQSSLGVFMLAAGMLACSSPQTEPETPAEEPSVDEILGPPASQKESTSTEESDSESVESEDTSSSSSASAEDFQEALQVVLQDDALISQMNLEEPGRFPIKVSGKDIPSDIEVQALTANIEVVPAPEDPKKDPVLVFTKIELTSTSGTFKYEYGIEGVKGTSRVGKTEGRWVLKSSRITTY